MKQPFARWMPLAKCSFSGWVTMAWLAQAFAAKLSHWGSSLQHVDPA